MGGWLAGEIKNRFQNTNFLCRFFISLCDNSIARNIDSTGYRAANNFALFSFTARKCVFFAQANCNYLGYEKCSFYDLLMQGMHCTCNLQCRRFYAARMRSGVSARNFAIYCRQTAAKNVKSIKRKGAPSERRTQFSFYFIWKI